MVEKGQLFSIQLIRIIPLKYFQVFEPATQDKWKKAALNSGKDITLNMAEWIIDELQFKAMIYETTEVVALYNGDVTKSDTNLPDSLFQEMRSQFAVLEYDLKPMQYFHPGILSQERDLISMALYPLLYGRTRILTDRILGLDDALKYIGKGEVIPVPKETGITREDIAWRVLAREDIKVRPYSRKYQVLPSDWELGDDGQWHIASYINNLHPVKHRNLYKVIEQTFNRIIPQWNATLTPLKDMLHSRARIEYHKAEYYPVPKEIAAQAPQIHPKEAQSEFAERTEKWRMENYRAIQPDAGKFIPWAVPPWLMDKLPEDLPSAVRIERGVDLNRDYKDRGLQVITRLLGVDLTPENPSFETDWHVEGTMVSLYPPIIPPTTTVLDNNEKHKPERAHLRRGIHTIRSHQRNRSDHAIPQHGRIRHAHRNRARARRFHLAAASLRYAKRRAGHPIPRFDLRQRRPSHHVPEQCRTQVHAFRA